jgi:hypothetical protein
MQRSGSSCIRFLPVGRLQQSWTSVCPIGGPELRVEARLGVTYRVHATSGSYSHSPDTGRVFAHHPHDRPRPAAPSLGRRSATRLGVSFSYNFDATPSQLVVFVFRWLVNLPTRPASDPESLPPDARLGVYYLQLVTVTLHF